MRINIKLEYYFVHMMIGKMVYIVPCESVKRKSVVKIKGKKVSSKDREKVCTAKEAIEMNNTKKMLLVTNIRLNPPHSCYSIP